MSFVSFLKKVGLGIIKYVPPILGLGSIAVGSIPGASIAQPYLDKLNAIFAAGQAIEKDFAVAFSGQQTGPQKLLALTANVSDILKQIELISQHEIADDALFQKGSQEIAQGVVDVMQSLKGKDGSTVSGTETIKS